MCSTPRAASRARAFGSSSFASTATSAASSPIRRPMPTAAPMRRCSKARNSNPEPTRSCSMSVRNSSGASRCDSTSRTPRSTTTFRCYARRGATPLTGGAEMKLILGLLLLVAGNALAQSWPTKPLRVIVTFSPGGSSDIVARLIAIPLQTELGQTVVIDNKPGAGGTVGALEAARAAPDGYTLLLSNSAPISISPAMQDEPRYDPVKSFTHVSYIGSVANVFVVHPSVPAKSMAELIGWIKAQPNPVNYGSGGIGSIRPILRGKVEKEHRP